MQTLTDLSPWAALLVGLYLLFDDVVLAPRRQLAAAPGVAPVPGHIRTLRWVLLIALLGTVRWMFQSAVVDFSLVLVVATAATGILWGLDRFFLRPMRMRRAAQAGKPAEAAAAEPVSVEYARSFFPVILVVLVLRSFVFEPFRIPSDSMMPTLLDGDFIFVNKFEYGLRWPVLNDKIIDIGDPRRGDVVVFRKPSDPHTNFIKRLVGLPNDEIVVRERRVYVNGELMPMTIDGVYLGTNPLYDGARVGVEHLGPVGHRVMYMPRRMSAEGTFRVPPGHYFFMGDNRDNSEDSRYPDVGMVPEDNLVGRAVRIWFNWNGFRHWPTWSRIGDRIE